VTWRINTGKRAVPVVVLCGFWAHATTEVADRLLADHPLAASGRILLTVAPEGYEPDQIRTAGGTDSAPHIVTVVPADLLLDGLTDDRALRAVGLHRADDDERSIGELVARQIEQADTVVLAGRLEGDDEWEAEQLRTLLRRIAPWSGHSSVEDLCLSTAGRTEPVAAVTRGLRGRAPGVHHPSAEHGVVSCLFQARRPFHPGRLHDALDEITEGVLRSRGTFWLASRPDIVMTWESADSLSIGAHSGWLAAAPDGFRDDVEEERRLAAAVDWDPYYDDRGQHLAFVGIDIDPVGIHRALTRCLLTDAELADGWDSWTDRPDPFERCFRLVATEEKPQ
jgi:G3E family GTPase